MKVAFVLLIALNFSGVRGQQQRLFQNDPSPNIILILADDMGYGDVSSYNKQSIETPNIDALANDGMKFTDFHSNGTTCTPTRAALLTGRYQQRSGLENVLQVKNADQRNSGLPLSEFTIAELVKKKGYATALFGKWHLGYQKKFNPIHQGFDEFIGDVSGNVDYHSHVDTRGNQDWWSGTELKPEDGYVTEVITKHGKAFIEKNKKKPFFLYLSHKAPHGPFQGPDDQAVRVEGKRSGKISFQDEDERYKEILKSLDSSVGEIVAAVKKAGIEENTLIIFCSDNGPIGPGNAGGLRGRKSTLWEGGHRVPGIFYWPGRIKPGSISAETAMTMDIFPTISSITGAKPEKDIQLDGVDLSKVIFESGRLAERPLFWRSGGGKNRVVRKGKWKLLKLREKGERESSTKLYNLSVDLAEKNDLSQKSPDKVKELENLLKSCEEGLKN